MNLKYRPEIDGLRALAVISVIAYNDVDKKPEAINQRQVIH